MAHKVRWLTISMAFVLAALPMIGPSEASAAGPYEYLLLDASEASAMGLEVLQIIDNSADGNIALQGKYKGVSQVDTGMAINFTVNISRVSPTDDFSFETVSANCKWEGYGCVYPDCRSCYLDTTYERTCYSRYEDGYTDFGLDGIDRNRCTIGGTTVFSVSGLKLVVGSSKLDYGMTQEVWDDCLRRHNEFASAVAQKVRANYDAQTIALTLTPFSTSYAPGETVVISGNVADSSDSSPITGASVAVNVAGTPFSPAVDSAGDFAVDFPIPGDVGNVGYPVTVTASAPGYPDVTENVGFNVGDMPSLSVTVDTDKDGYVAGDTVVIQGNVTDGVGGVPGAAVTVNVSGSTMSTTADGSGGYRVEYPIAADAAPSTFNVTVTATGSTSGTATAATTFTVGDVMSVEIETDKDLYLIGDTVYCTVTVKDSTGQPVPGASVDGTATYTDSGRSTVLSGTTDSSGQTPWTFTWGQTPGGDTIAEGKLKVELTATRSGLPDGTGSILIAGCGDKEKGATEDCLDCPEDCACGPNEVCDPSSDFRNSDTMCSPKVAYVFVSNGLSAYHEWWASDDIAGIRKTYAAMGYTVPPTIYVDHINEIAPYLSRPSTKALAYAGHGEDPGGMPTIEAAEATTGNFSVKSAIAQAGTTDKGFLGVCQFGPYAVKWVDSKDKLEKIMADRVEHPNLEYVFMFSCYSLDNLSMRDYLLQSGGTYWGYKGKLPGSASLVKSVKP
ncbi:MAG: hypothetical protein JW846_10470 [Dehalococcoidia bacterium]|nr:hypothetical protein [Dehalococcoidia bacterium]